MKNEKLCLIGCGWLGKPLAKKLLAEGFQLSATTARDQAAEFKNDGVPYIQLDLRAGSKLPHAIQLADILIYTIPPLEFSLVKKFFDQIPQDKRIIFTSSTSVYGKNMGDVDETVVPDLTNTNSPVLVETENYLRKRFSRLTIIRPGGLYGENRHPVFFLQGKKGLTTGVERLHLAHHKDCIAAISAILKDGIWNETFNIVSDLRVPKRDYYTEMAMKLNLTPPEYVDQDNRMIQTSISNEKSKLVLKINYLDPSQLFYITS